jgi:hypothetical protein
MTINPSNEITDKKNKVDKYGYIKGQSQYIGALI